MNRKNQVKWNILLNSMLETANQTISAGSKLMVNEVYYRSLNNLIQNSSKR